MELSPEASLRRPPHPVESELELSIVMPCLNEAETIATCVEKGLGFLKREGIAGEVVVADNGSTDGSQNIASRLGARVIDAPTRGYGAALIAGIFAARGRFVIMGDADDSYDFNALEPFLRKLRDGADLVMGNRFRGGIKPGAMPPLHRHLDNPVLSFVGRMVPTGDVAALTGALDEVLKALPDALAEPEQPCLPLDRGMLSVAEFDRASRDYVQHFTRERVSIEMLSRVYNLLNMRHDVRRGPAQMRRPF